MTLKEAAVSLGVTPDTLRQQIAAGRLKAVKRGRDWWVTKGEVERYRLASSRHIHWPDRIGPDVRCVYCGARVTDTGTVIEPL